MLSMISQLVEETHNASGIRWQATLWPHLLRFMSLLPVFRMFPFNAIKFRELSHWKNGCPPTNNQERNMNLKTFLFLQAEKEGYAF